MNTEELLDKCKELETALYIMECHLRMAEEENEYLCTVREQLTQRVNELESKIHSQE